MVTRVSRVPAIRPTTDALSIADRWDHFLARWGVDRSGHRVEAGLYALGGPTPDSPVLVTANYTLSFDALRSALGGLDAYILVLDTQGINVWCAAGKGTFGTDELVSRIKGTRLHDVVRHRVLILPQLGAPGVAAHDVKNRSAFEVKYGPVRAVDLPEYLEARRATPEMRQVRFALRDRLTLIPVELVHVLLPTLAGAAAAFLIGGPWAAMAVLAAVLAGVVLFPILLPWIPTREFSTKGFILGAAVALPFAAEAMFGESGTVWWLRVGLALAYLLTVPPVTAFLALNFTGSTTFTSRTGVRREIFAYVPVMAWMFGIGVALTVVLTVIGMVGGSQ
jgi:hypothetical protein